jgi:hypothetical protein
MLFTNIRYISVPRAQYLFNCVVDPGCFSRIPDLDFSNTPTKRADTFHLFHLFPYALCAVCIQQTLKIINSCRAKAVKLTFINSCTCTLHVSAHSQASVKVTGMQTRTCS